MTPSIDMLVFCELRSAPNPSQNRNGQRSLFRPAQRVEGAERYRALVSEMQRLTGILSPTGAA